MVQLVVKSSFNNPTKKQLLLACGTSFFFIRDLAYCTIFFNEHIHINMKMLNESRLSLGNDLFAVERKFVKNADLNQIRHRLQILFLLTLLLQGGGGADTASTLIRMANSPLKIRAEGANFLTFRNS